MDLRAAHSVRVTRLVHGVPVGGELDYLDEGTLSAVFSARRKIWPCPQCAADEKNRVAHRCPWRTSKGAPTISAAVTRRLSAGNVYGGTPLNIRLRIGGFQVHNTSPHGVME